MPQPTVSAPVFSRHLDTPIGPLTLQAANGALCRIQFGKIGHATASHPALDRAARQLDRYFDGTLRVFNLPLAAHGTPFQLRVWQALVAIPYGQKRTYGEIARAIGNANACRAVGGANRANPLPIVVPCHRVLGADGSLTGYSGLRRLDIKAALLSLEAR